jgi:hypothetical protein
MNAYIFLRNYRSHVASGQFPTLDGTTPKGSSPSDHQTTHILEGRRQLRAIGFEKGFIPPKMAGSHC